MLCIDQGRRREINQPTPSETVTSHLQGGNTHHTHSAPLSAGDPLRGMAYDVLEFYPDTKLALQLWNVYVKSVDPVLKILHIPTAQSTVIATILEPRSAGSSTVALTFAIYFAAVTALGHDSVDNNNDPINLTAQEKKLFLKNYKMCLDRLLMAPDLMDHPEMMTLQALAIYAVSTYQGWERPSNLTRLIHATDKLHVRPVYESMEFAGAHGCSMVWLSGSPK